MIKSKILWWKHHSHRYLVMRWTKSCIHINTSYLTDSYFCSNMLIRSSTYGKKIFLIFLHAGAIFFLFILLTSFEENHKFSNKNNYLPIWRKIRNIFFTIFTWPNWTIRANRAKILAWFQFEGKTDVLISQVRRVKFVLI